jgi:hypothetical protein
LRRRQVRTEFGLPARDLIDRNGVQLKRNEISIIFPILYIVEETHKSVNTGVDDRHLNLSREGLILALL